MQSYEKFNEEQKNVLQRYVSNTSSNIFVLRNFPEVIKGALFSRYSRSNLGLRSLLLKEFILNKDTAFSEITCCSGGQDQEAAINKAQDFYNRILDGYGDDSISELGGAHLALENISMIAANKIEHLRIGGSPLEKSTRYIYFDQKVNGEYLFYKEPILMTSAYRDIYLNTCNFLFDTYSKMIPKLSLLMKENFPKDNYLSTAAYEASLRAKVLDCLRGLLPASALTNMGIFGNGRFFESLIKKLNTSNLSELQEISNESFAELSKVIPSFIRRANASNKYYLSYAGFVEQMKEDLKLLAKNHQEKIQKSQDEGINLIYFDPEAPSKVAAALLYDNMSCNLKDLQDYCRELPEEEIERILDAACMSRENRRHKSPRALEQIYFTFEITADFGIFRDLHRHRMLSSQSQLLTCNHGYFIPEEIIGLDIEREYKEAMSKAKETYDIIVKEFPEEAQYIVPMAYNMKWYFHVHLRSLQWITELRSSPAGHPNYRKVAQELCSQVIKVFPQFERFFKFVDFEKYDFGRLQQESKKR